MDCVSAINATRAVDLGLYPIPITYQNHSSYSSKTSQFCSFITILMFLIYIIAAEIIPWSEERNFSQTSSEQSLNAVDISYFHADLISFLNFTVQSVKSAYNGYDAYSPNAIIETGLRCHIEARNDHDFFLDGCIGNCTGPSTTFFDGFTLCDSEREFIESFEQTAYVLLSPCKMIDSNQLYIIRTFAYFSIYYRANFGAGYSELIGKIEHSNADISTQYIEGFVKSRKSDYFHLVGPGSFVLDLTFQKIRIRRHSIWFSNVIVDEEIVYTKPNPATGRNMNYVAGEMMNIEIILRLHEDEIIVEVHPETFSQLAARIGGLGTLLVTIGLLLRLYNANEFHQNAKGLDYGRISQAVEIVESAEKDEGNLHIVPKELSIIGTCDKAEIGQLQQKLSMHIKDDKPMDLLDLLIINTESIPACPGLFWTSDTF